MSSLKDVIKCGCGALIPISNKHRVACRFCGAEYKYEHERMPLASPEVVHREATTTFTFTAFEYHDVSISVVAPTEVEVGTSFSVEITVVCITFVPPCDLTGKTVEILDHTGAVVGTGTLSGWMEPIYENYATIVVIAPTVAGSYTWTVRFPEQSPHKEAKIKILARIR